MIEDLLNVISSTLVADAEQIIACLPMIVGAIAILGVGFFAGRIIGRGIERLLGMVLVDELINKSMGCNVANRCGISVSHISGRLVAWFVYISFAVAAFDILDIPMFSVLIHQIAMYIPHIIAAMVVLVGGLVVMNFGMDHVVKMLSTCKIPYFDIATSMIRVLLTFVVIVLALEQLMLDMTIVYVILTPVMWAVAAAIVLVVATKTIIDN